VWWEVLSAMKHDPVDHGTLLKVTKFAGKDEGEEDATETYLPKTDKGERTGKVP
jgi:hypothetical protein